MEWLAARTRPFGQTWQERPRLVLTSTVATAFGLLSTLWRRVLSRTAHPVRQKSAPTPPSLRKWRPRTCSPPAYPAVRHGLHRSNGISRGQFSRRCRNYCWAGPAGLRELPSVTLDSDREWH